MNALKQKAITIEQSVGRSKEKGKDVFGLVLEYLLR